MQDDSKDGRARVTSGTVTEVEQSMEQLPRCREAHGKDCSRQSFFISSIHGGQKARAASLSAILSALCRDSLMFKDFRVLDHLYGDFTSSVWGQALNLYLIGLM